MKLSKIFASLVTGEFHRHSLGDDVVDGILSPEHYGIVLPMLNQGIDSLHSRFNVRQNDIIVRLQPNIMTYRLHSDHAMYNNTDPTDTKPKYLHDSQLEPFHNVVVKILSIHNELGQERFMDDENKHWAIMCNSYDTFQHPYPDKDNAVSVVYQASIPDIVCSTDTDPSTVEVDIPIYFLDALCFYIGSRTHVGMNDQESMSESAHFTGLYDKAINDIKVDQMVRATTYTSDEFQRQGWV